MTPERIRAKLRALRLGEGATINGHAVARGASSFRVDGVSHKTVTRAAEACQKDSPS